MKLRFAAFLLLLGIAPSASAQPTVEVRPATANVSIGEKFGVTVQVHGSAGTTYQFPTRIGDGSVELVLPRPATRLSEEVVYEAQVFALGAEARIPEIEIPYTTAEGTTGAAKSAAIALNVISVIDPKDGSPAPADFAPPVPVLVSRIFWVGGAIAALFAVAVLVALVRRLRDPKRIPDPQITPPVSPEEDALTALDALTRAGRASVNPRGFYIQLIQILKQYLERRLEAPVLEMTSTETLSFVKGHPWTTPHAPGIRDLVTSADLVKFGGSSEASNAERQLELVREVVGRVDRLRRADLELESRASERKSA